MKLDHFRLPREQQLSWMPPGCVIQQDQELIDFIQQTGSTKAIGRGDIDHFRRWIDFQEFGPLSLCIYIQTDKFDFDNLINEVNTIIDKDIISGGQIYLAVNKYQIHPRKYAQDLPLDFDQAIEVYVKRHIHANVDLYHSCGLDHGVKFNWIHPLTRFYLTKI